MVLLLEEVPCCQLNSNFNFEPWRAFFEISDQGQVLLCPCSSAVRLAALEFTDLAQICLLTRSGRLGWYPS